MQHHDHADTAETLDIREQAPEARTAQSESAEGAEAPTTPLAPSSAIASADPTTGEHSTPAADDAPAVAPETAPSADVSLDEQPNAVAESATSAEGAGDDAPHSPVEAPVASIPSPEAPTPESTAPAAATPEAEETGESASIASPAQQSAATINVGAVLGAYRIVAILSATPGAVRYLATFAEQPEQPTPIEDGETEAEPQTAWFTIAEQPEAPATRLFDLVSLKLNHPRLMSPEAIVAQDGRFYLVMQSLRDTPETPVLSVGQGARLGAVEVLRAGVGLADGLSYLHRNGIAHLHVSPETLLVQQGRAYLTGLEEVTLLDWDTADSQQLYARDANFLARTLGALRGFTADTIEREEAIDETAGEAANDASAERQIRAIAIKGETEGFAGPDDVRIVCANALRALGVVVDALDTLGVPELPTRLVFVTGSATTVGRVRAENQDALAMTVFDLQDDVTKGGLDAPMGVFLVSDGMGGEAHGEIASRISARAVAVEMARHFTLPKMLWPLLSISPEENTSPSREEKSAERTTNGEPHADEEKPAATGNVGELGQALAQAVAEANRQTRVFARQMGATTGATLTAIATSGAQAALAHLGDSRAYLLREMQFIRLTEDHSLLARMEAMDHPLLSDPNFMMPRSVLYRSIGQDDEAPPDMLEFLLAPGDRLLLCSDGLWDELSDQTLGQELAVASDPQVCAERLIALANAAGGHDNSTAVVVFVSAAVPVDVTDSAAYAEAAPELAETPDQESAQGEQVATNQPGANGANGSHEADNLANIYAVSTEE